MIPEEQNPIGSVVTEILMDGRTDRQIDRHRSTLYYRYIICVCVYVCMYVCVCVCVCVRTGAGQLYLSVVKYK